jgi:Zn-dependent M16 (insulinase) family peptidase
MPPYGFELLREQAIAEVGALARLYRHRTGARLLSLQSDDENKVFGITFRTPASNSTGVAHILEHCVLCGSRRYPVKEPFVELVKGSLNTFLNAFTYPDKTCYPVASQNLQDFYNLVEVYLDAVLHPLLTRAAFEQEGWHYALAQPDDALAYKGVVYNEMKGAHSDPESLLADYSLHGLFPDTVYGVDSGGDPRVIPELTYADFCAFHRRYYHPANAWIFFSGNDDPDERLRLLEDRLAEYTPAVVASTVRQQPRFAAPRHFTHAYPVGAMAPAAGQGMVTVNWLLGSADAEARLAFTVLVHALIGSSGAPLRRALIDSGLGEDLAGLGLESELAEVCFGTGLRGVSGADLDRVEPLILEVLAGLARDGIDANEVAAAVNSLEFRLRENNAGSYPRGLVHMLSALGDWLYDGDPLAALAYGEPWRRVKGSLAQADFLTRLIRVHLLDNPHRVTVRLVPDPDLAARTEAEEESRLEAHRAGLSRAELEALVAANEQRAALQAAPDSPAALARLPRLGLADLEPSVRTVPRQETTCGGTPVLLHEQPTRGIIYLDLAFDLHAVPAHLLPLVPLFGRALFEMGAGSRTYVELSQWIGTTTGGIWAQSLTSARKTPGPAAAYLVIRAKAMAEQADTLGAILCQTLVAGRLDDQERFLQILLEEKAGEEAALVPGGHRFVGTRLRSGFDEAGWVAERLRGITYLFHLRALVEQARLAWPEVLAALGEVRQRLVRRSTAVASLTADPAALGRAVPMLERLLGQLNSEPITGESWPGPALARREGLAVPAQVNYVGQAANLYHHGYEPTGAAAVVSRHLANTWFWDRIRVQGGAYGAFASFDSHSGIISCLSYRDPNLVETLATYRQSGAYLAELELSEDERVRAVIGAIGDMDVYQLPDAKGFSSLVRWLTGTTDEYRQQFRHQVLATGCTDFHRFGAAMVRALAEAPIVVLGSAEALAAAETQAGLGLSVTHVL